MSKDLTVIALGIWVMVIPYLGVPGSWRTAILILTGIFIITIGFFLRAEAIARGAKRGGQHLFVENSSTQHQDVRYDRKEGISSLN